jgi:hypothetical protein
MQLLQIHRRRRLTIGLCTVVVICGLGAIRLWQRAANRPAGTLTSYEPADGSIYQCSRAIPAKVVPRGPSVIRKAPSR